MSDPIFATISAQGTHSEWLATDIPISENQVVITTDGHIRIGDGISLYSQLSDIFVSPTNAAKADTTYSLNYFDNPDFTVSQRGAEITAAANSTTYTADRWFVATSGASTTVSQIEQSRTPTSPTTTLRIGGASGLSGTKFGQRIESFYSQRLGNKTIIIDGWLFNGTSSAFTPKLNIGYATSVDNFHSVTPIHTNVALSVCPTNAWTYLSTTLSLDERVSNGLEITFDFGGVLNGSSKYLRLSEFSCAPSGTKIISEHPDTILAKCQRYFRVVDGGIYGYTPSSNRSTLVLEVSHPGMRAIPTVTQTDLVRVIDNSGMSYTQKSKGMSLVKSSRESSTLSILNFPTMTNKAILSFATTNTAEIYLSSEL